MDRSEIDRAKRVQKELKRMKPNIVVEALDDLGIFYQCLLSGLIGYSFITACIYVLTH